MTIMDFCSISKQKLSAIYDEAEANALVKYLLQERLLISFSEMKRDENRWFSPEQDSLLLNDINRLVTGEPIQHVLGYAWFNELKIKVSKDVLIPRPETEELVTFIRDYPLREGAVIIDICTGSGCIALALKSHFPFAEVVGVDVSEAALKVASENSRALGLSLSLIRWDVLTEAAPDLPKADVIVANPPYVLMEEINDMHPNVSNFEPHLALFVPDDDPLLFYKAISTYATRQLKPGGRLWFEIHKEYGDATGELLERYGFEDVRVYRDLSEHDRFVSAVQPTE